MLRLRSLASLLALLVSTQEAAACTISKGVDWTVFRDAATVMRARIVDFHYKPYPIGEVTLTFQVKEVLAGTVPPPTVSAKMTGVWEQDPSWSTMPNVLVPLWGKETLSIPFRNCQSSPVMIENLDNLRSVQAWVTGMKIPRRT